MSNVLTQLDIQHLKITDIPQAFRQRFREARYRPLPNRAAGSARPSPDR